MQYSLEKLVKGEADVVEFYQRAAEHWEEIWTRPETKTVESFAPLLFSEQEWFEKNCGGRWLGQEIMVISGLVGLYSTEKGFAENEDRAYLLYSAFQRSMCSIEVIGTARDVAKSFGLFETSKNQILMS